MRSLVIILAVMGMILSLTLFANSSTGEEINDPKTVHKAETRDWRNLKAIKQEKPDIPDAYKNLEQAFSQYWGLFIKKDYKNLYKMESSEFRKANPYNEEKYKKLTASNMKLTAVSALKVEKLNEKEVLVKGKYYYNIGAMKSLNRFSDSWISEEEGWKHVPAEQPFTEMRSEKKTDVKNMDTENMQQKNEVQITDKKNIEQTKGGVQ